MEGIFKPSDFKKDIQQIRDNGFDRGVNIGIPEVDKLYRVKLGMFTVVTGIPGHGKSELIDDFVIRLSRDNKWKFAFFSPENYPLSLHYVKLAEKLAGENFGKFDEADHRVCEKWISEHFTWIYPNEEKEQISLETILEKARYIKESEDLHGLIIDPWNELEHNTNGESETMYISKALSKIRRFARNWDIHVWLIAHPTKLTKNKDSGQYPVPTLYDISGSANWRNKADFGLVIHRPNMLQNEVTLYIQKVKFKQLGRIGQCDLTYNYDTGRFWG